ncbi:MAG: site-specific integrase [Gammaproteobacteria bacterium]|nr:site-specific integrase [Gammaproteobacteria bacterium]
MPKTPKSSYPIPQPIIDNLDNISELMSGSSSMPSKNTHDLLVVIEFLKQYDGNKATFNCYRKELERILQWVLLIQKKSLLDLTREDIEDYIKFCLKPPPSWIGTKKVAKFTIVNTDRIPNLEWRPFVATVSKSQFKQGKIPNSSEYNLSQKAIREIFVVLGSFYSYLISINKINYNPVASIRQKSKYIRKQQSSAPIRRLSDLQWQAVIETANSMANEDPTKHERTLFVISALYLMYLRVSELIKSDRWSPQMNHFFKDSYENWWFRTVGKGNKERIIAVNNDMLAALKRWRKYLNLSPTLPSADDTSALVPKLNGKDNISDTKLVYLIVQNCFNKTIEVLHVRNNSNEAIALEQASSHWLRHTGISDAINKHERPVAHVRDDAGHASIATTDRYNDITLKERHESAQIK